jgi:hypothetical protein
VFVLAGGAGSVCLAGRPVGPVRIAQCDPAVKKELVRGIGGPLGCGEGRRRGAGRRRSRSSRSGSSPGRAGSEPASWPSPAGWDGMGWAMMTQQARSSVVAISEFDTP